MKKDLARMNAEMRIAKTDECLDVLFRLAEAYNDGSITKTERNKKAGDIATRLFEIYTYSI